MNQLTSTLLVINLAGAQALAESHSAQNGHSPRGPIAWDHAQVPGTRENRSTRMADVQWEPRAVVVPPPRPLRRSRNRRHVSQDRNSRSADGSTAAPGEGVTPGWRCTSTTVAETTKGFRPAGSRCPAQTRTRGCEIRKPAAQLTRDDTEPSIRWLTKMRGLQAANQQVAETFQILPIVLVQAT